PLRRLGLALRGLRLDAGLTGQQLADRAGLSQSTVSRIELGQAMPSLADIGAWGEATGAAAGALAEIRALAEAAAVEAISWRRARGLAGPEARCRGPGGRGCDAPELPAGDRPGPAAAR